MKKVFNFLNKYVIYVLLAVIGVLLILYAIERGNKNDLSNNLIITKDSVNYLKNKNGELYAQVNTYIVTEDQLKQVNAELSNEIEKYKKQKPIIITKEVIKIVYKDTTLYSSISSKLDSAGNKQFDITWSSDTTFSTSNYIKVNGMSYVKVDSTLNVLKYGSSLDSLELGAKLYLGAVEEKNGMLKLNARTDFPGLVFTDVEGYLVDPMQTKSFKKLTKKKRFGLSGFGGIGTYFDDGGIRFIPTVGVGLTYDFFQF